MRNLQAETVSVAFGKCEAVAKAVAVPRIARPRRVAERAFPLAVVANQGLGAPISIDGRKAANRLKDGLSLTVADHCDPDKPTAARVAIETWFQGRPRQPQRIAGLSYDFVLATSGEWPWHVEISNLSTSTGVVATVEPRPSVQCAR